MTDLHTETWDLDIVPQSGWFSLPLGDLWRYRDLVYLLIRRDFVSQFKQTVLGPAWFVIQPLLTTIMFSIVFGSIAKLSTDGLPKVLFYLSGNIVWQYFAGCLMATSDTFTTNANLFGKVYFPRLVVPISIVISHLIKLSLQFLFFMGFWVFYAVATDADFGLTRAALLLPVLVLIMAVMALGLGIIFSSMTTKYRDLRFLLQFGVQLLMYATPVIYPLSSIGGRYRCLILANPMTPVIETFRCGFLGVGTFNWWHLAYSAGFAGLVLFVGAVVFTRVERTFMDTV